MMDSKGWPYDSFDCLSLTLNLMFQEFLFVPYHFNYFLLSLHGAFPHVRGVDSVDVLGKEMF